MDKTFPQLLLEHAQRQPSSAAMREKEYGIWQTLTWAELAALVESLACGLHEAGLARGDHIAVVGANCPRLYATMMAAQALGAVPIPLYQDAPAGEYVFPISNADVRFAFAQDQEQVDKLLEAREQCPQLAHIYFDDPRGLRNYHAPGLRSVLDLSTAGLALARQNPAFFREAVAAGQAQDVAAMFFTSGTTGQAKGVVHTHASLLDRASAGAEFDRLTAREEVLAYMPPAWIGQSMFSYAQWLACGYVVNCPESASTVMIDLKEIGPSYYFAPPRVFEALLTSVMIRMEDASAIKRKMFQVFMDLARRVGPQLRDGKSVGLFDRLAYAVGNLMVYGPLRNNLGMSRVRMAYTAGEAIGPDLFDFYRAIGVNLKQLYGSTETAVFVCMQPDNQVRADTVGIPCRDVQIQVSDSGEILVRSPGLLKEYYKNPAATAEVKTEDGWYRTGDAGFLDAQGHLKIIDRAKDVGRLANGAMFAPKYIENKLKFFPYIKEAVAVGDRREIACAMINIDFEAVGNWAERRNLPYAGYTDLAAKPQVLQLVKECVEKVNADLAADDRLATSQVHRFLVLHKELDADDGELTRTNKVRRGYVAEKYQSLVAALYGGKTEQFIETQVKFEDGRTGSVSATLPIIDAKTFPPLKAAA
ncbi:MAG TPA: AMP-binding protein [Ramlibacter sp.]|nr:AMP-binding protein [Ramlibacter sp.]